MIERTIKAIWHGTFAPFYYNVKLKRAIKTYERRMPSILNRVRGHDPIRIVFFPINIGMWKNDYLFQLLQSDSRFEPCVVSFFVPGDNPEFQRRNQEEMRSFFNSKGYPYYDMYNFETGQWLDVDTIKPDVVIYTQPVNTSYTQYRIQAFWDNALFYYIPYCMGMENETKGYNTLLFNICLKVFAPSEFHKNYWSSFFLNKGKNIVVTGYPSFDYLTRPVMKDCAKWKCCDKRKRVIWAPHHSITKEDLLSYSNFLEIAESMLELTRQYKDSIEFVFKPHPRLRPKLEQIDAWGKGRTESYYQKWKEQDNTNYVDGDYFDLFLSSDAMIHDCSTFMAEYLLTGNPVMFNLRDESAMNLNKYAEACLKQHYIGRSIEDIKEFLDRVVLGGIDYMKNDRIRFVEEQLKVGSDVLVAQRIYNEIKKDLN